MLTYEILAKYNEIAHFCTTREGGVSVGNYASNNLSPFSGDNAEHVAQNTEALTNWLQISSDRLVIPYQNHGIEIREITVEFFSQSSEQQKKYLDGVDAVFTRIPKLCIGITTADCVPLLFFDPEQKVIAAVHAGWRGTCARIASKTIETLCLTANCKPENLIVSIGPSISAEVYEVGTDVIDSFENNGYDISALVKTSNRTHYLNLWEANRQDLIRKGVLAQNIEISGICTFTEHHRFFSARRLGIRSGRLLSGIMIQ